MASIERRTRTTRVIAYIDGEKHCFPLGQVNKKTAERFANNIDALLNERRLNSVLSREVVNWLAGLDDKIHGLLVERELAEPRLRVESIGKLIDSYAKTRTDVTERRREKFKNAKDRLIKYFGDVAPHSVTPADAEEYSRWLLTQVASTTAMKECQMCSQFFRYATRKELISRNPFDGVSVGTSTNDERRVFVARDVVAKVIDACPDWQWRTVVALARYGGLRCSSEVALLKWTDFQWDADRFTVTSPKTKRYGKASRVVPLFPELRPFIDEAYFEMAKAGDNWVIPMLNGQASKNLGTTFKKIIARAGVEVWPKPFQNLRSSRQTELEKDHPTHVVCSWLGNSPKVAHKHYLTVCEDDFQAAIENGGRTGDFWGTQTPATPGIRAHKKSRNPIKVRENASFSHVVGILENARVAEEGLEVPLVFKGKTYILAFSGDVRGISRSKPAQD